MMPEAYEIFVYSGEFRSGQAAADTPIGRHVA
jgi:hypothetical protein